MVHQVIGYRLQLCAGSNQFGWQHLEHPRLVVVATATARLESMPLLKELRKFTATCSIAALTIHTLCRTIDDLG